MKKNAVKWILAVVFVALLAVTVPVAATSSSDYRRQQEDLRRQREAERRRLEEEQKKLNEISGNITGLEGEAGAVAGEIGELDESLVVLIASVELISEEIAEKEESIAATIILYEEAKATEEAQYAAMKLRLKHMYESKEASIIEVLIDSTSLSDMLNRLEYMEQLNEYDEAQLDAYILIKEETNALREQLEDERAALAAQQHELEEEKAEMERLMAEKQALYEDYEAMIAQARRQAATYSANIKAKNDEIKRLERAEADARAKELAAIKAEEEARRAANRSSAGGNYLSPSSFSGSTGERIAAYARQFTGNPYVAGGTSLTNGADCSGFIWRVYRDFGYNVPRQSASFRTAGTGVEYANAQPGDIICYAGHVGIYIGNGQIVHASTERTGIIVTAATYKAILAVRRLV